jgi:mono/diheme cytochrome c family protein
MESLLRGGIVVCVLLAGTTCRPGWAASDEDAVSRGEVLYRAHCAACHGSAAHGDGPVAGELKTPPTDLTWLRDDAGAFAADRSRRFIDGREEVRGHGSREMPIWGLTFQDWSRPEEQEDEVAGRIDDLVHYLRSIQIPSDDQTRNDD